MSKIEINNCVYNIHPIYNLYGADEDGNIINIVKKVLVNVFDNKFGYLMCNIRKRGQKDNKRYYIHRFVYECFHGIIPNEKVIDHINDIKNDNRISNLQLMTQQENCKKSAKNRDYSFLINNHKNRKCVKAINIETKEITYYNSIYATGKYLDISLSIISGCCKGRYGSKSGRSKKNGNWYKFEFVKEEELPDNYKKLTGLKPKWNYQEYVCPRCDKVMKKCNKYFHNKKCQ